jgi:hypothetical protein
MHPLWIALAAAAPLALAACGSDTGPLEASAPRVTFAYSNDAEYTAAKDKAADYCDDEYDKDAVLVSAEGEGTMREVTFTCE